MKYLNACRILAICFKGLRLWLVILLLCTILGCTPGYREVEVYLRVTHPSNYLPVFEVSEDERFESSASARITFLRVYSLGDTLLDERIYWDIQGSRPGSRRRTPVRVSSITYGIVPDGFEEHTPPRRLEPGVEYCVIVGGHLSEEDPVECFIYRP